MIMLTGIIIYGYAGGIETKSGNRSRQTSVFFIPFLRGFRAGNILNTGHRLLATIATPTRNLCGYIEIKRYIMNNLTFNGKAITPVVINNLPYLTVPQISEALQYAQSNRVADVYNRHSDEFTQGMSMLVKSGRTHIRVFSLRGCHLIAMFSKTPIAKEFRKWLLDLLEHYNQPLPIPSAIPTLDAKILGGIVKKCCAVALKKELASIKPDVLLSQIIQEKAWELAKVLIDSKLTEARKALTWDN